MSNSTTEKDRFAAFVAHLDRRRDDRGIMANLRHGFSNATAYRAWPHVAGWGDLTNDWQRAILLTVAAGYATHGRTDSGDGNLGRTLRRLATGDGASNEALSSFDGRFRRLLSCDDVRDLCALLPGILRAAERRGVGVDFVQLYRDLTYWGERVKVAWAAAYWGTLDTQATAAIEGDTAT